MQADRFFSTTRGKIVSELRSRRAASAVELAAVLGLSPNAIRQQLMVLARDGFVLERPVRRGRTKPTYVFSLTREGEKLFPQQYDKMLSAVLHEVRRQFGETGVRQVFHGIAQRAVIRASSRVTAADPEGKLIQITDFLRDRGVSAQYERTENGFVLHEHNCPYSEVVKEHPEMCNVIHAVLDSTVGAKHQQTESLATGGTECRFEVKAP
jgi:predicted ArsR family transcriptional regulator